MEVAPGSVVFTALGDTETLAATVRDRDGAVLPDAAVTWSSSDPAVASVEAGTVTALSNGEASVTATSGSASGAAAVRVEQVAARLNAVPRNVQFSATGDTARLSATVYDANDHEVAGATVEWSSSDSRVATVSDGGLVTAVSAGTAEVVAVSGAAQDTVAVNVDSTDRGILAAFYHAAGGPSWRHSDNWLTDAPLREWYGVEAGTDDRVIRLELRENGAVGTLAPELGRLSHLETLDLFRNKLTGRLPPELGNAVRLREIDLGHNQFRGPIPPELGRLKSLRLLNLEYMWLSGSVPAELGALSELQFLNFYSNTLTGRVPPELGNLRNLERLVLADNQLTGSIPPTFTRLENLSDFRWHRNDGLCAPGTEEFEVWRRGRRTDGPRCDAADRATLEYVFENLSGESWTRATGWLGDGLLDRWYGIDTDSLGRVEALDLSNNGLEGRLPDQISELTSMTTLRLEGNRLLYGPIPQSFTALPLREFRYGGTDLCEPNAPTFQAWLNAIPDRQGADEPCPELSDRDILAMLYEATGGSAWTDNTNWLSDAPLGDWYGVETNGEGAVTELVIYGNNLRGRIPPEIGELEALTILDLDFNWLRGPVPAALADLERLRILSLHSNQLEGSIPPELGTLPALEVLKLRDNRLTGRIPPTLGELTPLVELWLNTNRLEGPIPPELATYLPE
ncbi:MAG: Ig-like domain-containing protein [Gemmatimonadota bacterium]|uniref:Ig-like domain-containing protein n=1 Tax=Candidatus Palauibacter scopulicola TaxID=3056741 RepID=UPI0023A3F252|nr:Ig-like domain-containing protein [Candidatus Palauibacter scopulicola]MDE2663333.1 Ig-like domain-containing protein [Candidatus Palauibacter scopulicola]